MPYPVQRAKDQAGEDWAVALLQARQREAAPARLLGDRRNDDTDRDELKVASKNKTLPRVSGIS
jgi:hypothetical protein